MQQILIHRVFLEKQRVMDAFIQDIYSDASAVVSIPCKSSTANHDAAGVNSSESLINSSSCCVTNLLISKDSYLLKQNAFLNEAEVVDSTPESYQSIIFYDTSNATRLLDEYIENSLSTSTT